MTFRPFIKSFISQDSREVYIIGVDESVESGYSHVSLLTHEMRDKRVKVLHHKLIAQNRVKYAGKSLEFRLTNPREFIYRGKKNIDVILVDDIITTGTTLNEAKRVLEKNSLNVLFALTLADVL
jgi:competence protein ComFC